MVLIKRAQKELEVVEVHGSKRLTGAFLLADGMKENKKLEKLWLLECPKLSGGALVSLVGHLARACHEAGTGPLLKSMRLSGSTNVEGRHVRLLERFRLSEALDVAPCPHCPKAGHVMMCGVYSMLNGEGAPADVLGHAIVRDGEIGCENCLVPCSICAEYFCRAHLFRLNCGLQEICCKCCTQHSCSVCDI
ncbi:unnamed protein product [Closterium sp. Yama58-4]|nr:unnamed protein product [Closterium sp. Yama58-4]